VPRHIQVQPILPERSRLPSSRVRNRHKQPAIRLQQPMNGMKSLQRVMQMLQAVPHGDAIEFPGTLECSKFCEHFQPEGSCGIWIHLRARGDPALFTRDEQKRPFAAPHVEQSSPGSPFRFPANEAEALFGPEGGGETVPFAVVSAIVRCQILRLRIGDTNCTLGAPQNTEVLTCNVVVYTREIGLQLPGAKKAGLLEGVGLRHGVLSAYTRQSPGRHSFQWEHCERLTCRPGRIAAQTKGPPRIRGRADQIMRRRELNSWLRRLLRPCSSLSFPSS